MIRKQYFYLFILSLSVSAQAIAQQTPQLVAPGVISTGMDYCTTLSPDGKTMYFVHESSNGLDAIMKSTLVNNQWDTPQKVSFTGTFSDTDPLLSPDGKTMFFMTNRNASQEGWMDDYDIWAVDMEGDDWGEPYRLPDYINTSFNEGFPSTTSNGNLYFFRSNKNGHTEQDIWFAEKVGGGFDFPKKVKGGINSERWDGHPFVSADEKYMVFYSNKDGGFGSCDLYISFREDNKWTKPKNLGSKINTETCEMVPYVSHDQKTLYFTRSGDGKRNIYQIDFQSLIKNLRQ